MSYSAHLTILALFCFVATGFAEQPFIIGIAGGTASGKTTFAQQLKEALGPDRVTLISIDNYYRDYSHLPRESFLNLNLDDPVTVELSLLKKHVGALKQGYSVEQPIYLFHGRRSPKTLTLHPKRFIIIEGIFALWLPELRDLYDLSLFIDATADIRFIRRLIRDNALYGEQPDEIIYRYLHLVRPAHESFVEPTKQHAHLILCGENAVDELIKTVLDYLATISAL